MGWLLTWLVHGLAIALVTRFALRALPGLSAATRYAMWWAALVLVLILPIVRGLTLDAGARARAFVVANVPFSSSASSASAGSSTSPRSPASSSSSSSPQGSQDSQVDLASAGATPMSLPPISLLPFSLPRVPDWFLSIVIGLWLGCAMLGVAQVAYSVQTVRRLKASCRRLSVPPEADLPMWSAVRARGRAARVRASDSVRTAAVLGLTRPVIAVPRDAAEALTAHEIDQIVLHEYAHVQRYDDWTKLLQVLIGAFAGWHPAVRLMMREIDFEREAACDDYVVDVTGAPRAYARCLTKVIEMMPGSPSALDFAAVPHAFGSASQATTRIERLLDRKRPSGRLAVMPAIAGTVTLAVLSFCTVHALPIATDLPRTQDSQSMTRDGATLASAGTAPTGASRDDRGHVLSPSAMAAEPGNTALARGVNGLASHDQAARAHDIAAADVIESGDGRGDNAAAATGARPLRIAAASALPIELSFARFSPLSRLTGAPPAAAPPAATPVPGHTRADSHADSTALPVERNASPANASATPTSASPANSDANAAPTPATTSATTPATTPATQAPAAPRRYASDNRSGASPHRPASTPDMREMREATPPRAAASFALGPVVAAGDSDAMPEADDAGHIERAWENTRDATSKAVGVSARAVGTATKTAGDATKTATNKAAAGVKAGGTHTKRAFGRVKRTIASVF
jgi:beta-lactamase regulating signal transducer with metallopeptidase domain